MTETNYIKDRGCLQQDEKVVIGYTLGTKSWKSICQSIVTTCPRMWSHI